MIFLAVGLTGAGKTWFITKLVQERWQQGETVYPNTTLFFDEENTRVTYWDQLSELYHVHHGILLIDEAQKLFNSHKWASFPTAFADLIAEQRKNFLDVYTTTQDFKDIDIQFRKKVHVLYKCQSMMRFPITDSQLPMFQILKVTRFKREFIGDTETIKWIRQKNSYYFLSRWWTKKIYDTFTRTFIDKYVTKTFYDYKKKSWLTKIYNRELVNRGRARL